MIRTTLAFVGGIVVTLYLLGMLGVGDFVMRYGANVECVK